MNTRNAVVALEMLAEAVDLQLSPEFDVYEFAGLLQSGCEIVSPDDERTAEIAELLALKFAFVAEGTE